MNLLPQKEKETIRKEYYARFIVVALSIFLVLLVVANLFLVPSYVLSRVKFSIAQKELQKIEKSETENRLEELEDVANKVNEKLEFLALPEKRITIRSLINEVLKKRGSVSIESFSYKKNVETSEDEEDDDEGKEQPAATIRIQGIAPDRPSLIGFRDLLEEGGTFQSVELPISSLVSEKDIGYTMNMEVKKKEGK